MNIEGAHMNLRKAIRNILSESLPNTGYDSTLKSKIFTYDDAVADGSLYTIFYNAGIDETEYPLYLKYKSGDGEEHEDNVLTGGDEIVVMDRDLVPIKTFTKDDEAFDVLQRKVYKFFFT